MQNLWQGRQTRSVSHEHFKLLLKCHTFKTRRTVLNYWSQARKFTFLGFCTKPVPVWLPGFNKKVLVRWAFCLQFFSSSGVIMNSQVKHVLFCRINRSGADRDASKSPLVAVFFAERIATTLVKQSHVSMACLFLHLSIAAVSLVLTVMVTSLPGGRTSDWTSVWPWKSLVIDLFYCLPLF